MKITMLVENTTNDKRYKSKHGISMHISTSNHNILFDLGSNDLFYHNAQKLNIDLKQVDILVISHAHIDHGGGLKKFLEINSTAKIYIKDNAFEKYYTKVFKIPIYIGLDATLKDNNRIIFVNNDLNIDNELFIFSNVFGRKSYSKSNDSLYYKKDNKLVKDNFSHELNLLISENNNYALFSGCAHNGIINIQNKLIEIKNIEPTHVISGLHLYNPITRRSESSHIINEISTYLQESKATYYTCHCTGKRQYNKLKSVLKDKIHYLSTGSSITI